LSFRLALKSFLPLILMVISGCGAAAIAAAPVGTAPGVVVRAAGAAPRVFVLKARGVCDGCAEGVSKMLFAKGISSQILGTEDLKRHVGANDLLVIGGSEPDIYGEYTVKQELVKAGAFQWLKDHIRKGGRYIGICSGAYLTEAWINQQEGIKGLDIFPGKVDNYVLGTKSKYVRTRWVGERAARWTYFQDGPAFYPAPGAPIEVLARFTHDDTVAAAVFTYGTGKVGVISPHPEADRSWGDIHGIRDPDGVDYDLGVSVFRRVLE